LIERVLRLSELRELAALAAVPIIALTATATLRVMAELVTAPLTQLPSNRRSRQILCSHSLLRMAPERRWQLRRGALVAAWPPRPRSLPTTRSASSRS
jgi:hypothetical protein